MRVFGNIGVAIMLAGAVTACGEAPSEGKARVVIMSDTAALEYEGPDSYREAFEAGLIDILRDMHDDGDGVPVIVTLVSNGYVEQVAIRTSSVGAYSAERNISALQEELGFEKVVDTTDVSLPSLLTSN